MTFEHPEESIEEKKGGHAYELFNLSSDQKEELAKRVESFNGLVRIFIHPIAELQSGEEIKNIKRVGAVLGRSMVSEKAPPLIIFENKSGIEGWKEPFNLNDSPLPNDIYLVPTIFDYPYPLLPDKPEPTERDERGYLTGEDFEEYVHESFIKLVTFLKDIGVKEVLVGGTSLDLIDNTITYCVGNFIMLMQHYSPAKIKLSLGTAPLNRTDVKDSHPELL